MNPKSAHELRNGMGNVIGIILELKQQQKAILDSQRTSIKLFDELKKQLKRVFSVVEEEVGNADKQPIRNIRNSEKGNRSRS